MTAVPIAVGTWMLWRVPEPQELRSDEYLGPAPRVSVIVPARDEAASLGVLLDSLANQTVAAFEVIVVDDHSSDATARLAHDAGAIVVESGDLPTGWTGKTWALHQGFGVTRGDVFLFLDADVTLAPGALAAVVAEWRRRGGLISVQPQHRPVRPYEHLSAVCNVVVMMGTGAFAPVGRGSPGLAFGPCLAISRDDYVRLGGHAHPSVAPMAAEDIGLARRARAEGVAVTILGGGELVGFRMYPGGPRQMLDGWSRTLATGVEAAPLVATAAVVVWVAGALVGVVKGVAAIRSRRASLALGYAAWVAHMWWAYRRVGRFGVLAAVAYPAPLAVFLGEFARSQWQVRTGRTQTWRGRVLPRQGAFGRARREG